MVMTGRQLPVVPDLDALAELVRLRPGLYLRQSVGPDDELPDNARVDVESGVRMPGLSVATIDPEPWWPRAAVDWIARRVCTYVEPVDVHGRHPWLLTGRAVGLGPLHEPLVVDVEPVAWLAPEVLDEARAHYRERFDVASTSVG